MVQEMVKKGADVICFSADKMLGGPQGGIICGREKYLHIIKKDPMYRTFRVGKMTLSILQSTLLFYLQGRALQHLPVWQMISMPYDKIRIRCNKLARSLKQKGFTVTCHDGMSLVGGGSLPGKRLPTRLLYIESKGNIEKPEQKLRLSYPAVLGRIKDGYLILDPRTIEPQYDKKLVNLLYLVFKEEGEVN